MTQEEFSALKPGDKVRIVKRKRGDKWNLDGEMDKWLGKVMTVRGEQKDFGGEVYRSMEEDREEFFGDGWHWYPEMIKCKVPKFQKGDRVRMKLYEEILEMAGETKEEAEKEGCVRLPSGRWFYDDRIRYCGGEYTVNFVEVYLNFPWYGLKGRKGLTSLLFPEDILDLVEEAPDEKEYEVRIVDEKGFLVDDEYFKEEKPPIDQLVMEREETRKIPRAVLRKRFLNELTGEKGPFTWSDFGVEFTQRWDEVSLEMVMECFDRAMEEEE